MSESNSVLATGLGRKVAIATAILTVITFIVAVMTPPLSGPGCTIGCFSYPYTDIISRFPRDYVWMYPAMLVSMLFFVLISCVHYTTAIPQRIYSHLAQSFAFLSMAILVINYFVQVSVIQPSLMQGETEGIALLSQYNPHGLFIVLEEIGFMALGMALLCLAPIFGGATKLDSWIRWTGIVAFISMGLSFGVVSYMYGIEREYIFEIAVISISWMALISSSIALSRYFKKLQLL